PTVTVNRTSSTRGVLVGSLNVPKSKITLFAEEFRLSPGAALPGKKAVLVGPYWATPVAGAAALTVVLNVLTLPVVSTSKMGSGKKSVRTTLPASPDGRP